MSYLKDYLRVIPKADADAIKANIAANQEVFDILKLSEKEYAKLIEQLVENHDIQSNPVALSEIITADDLNAFYTNVLVDLSRLFPEQHQIELAVENYDEIHQAYIEEMKKEIDALKRNIDRMLREQRGESGLIIDSYSFEPEGKEQHMEALNDATAYLFTDRHGMSIPAAKSERLFHTYYLSLSKQNQVNALENNKGQTTARLEVLYESPYTIENHNENYTIDKAIDGNSQSFWLSTALKPNNTLDSISISPRREG